MLQSTVAKKTPDAGARLTVDQLARLAGTTTRNIRAFQTLGLLPRPTMDGRTGRYGQDHLDRLRSVLRLQRSGFSLAALTTLFEAWEEGLTLDQVLGVRPSSAPRPSKGHDDDAFDDWPAVGSGRGLAVVPTTVLDLVAS